MDKREIRFTGEVVVGLIEDCFCDDDDDDVLTSFLLLRIVLLVLLSKSFAASETRSGIFVVPSSSSFPSSSIERVLEVLVESNFLFCGVVSLVVVLRRDVSSDEGLSELGRELASFTKTSTLLSLIHI